MFILARLGSLVYISKTLSRVSPSNRTLLGFFRIRGNRVSYFERSLHRPRIFADLLEPGPDRRNGLKKLAFDDSAVFGIL